MGTKDAKETDKARDFLNWLLNPKPLKEIGGAGGKTVEGQKATTTKTTARKPISGMANPGKVISGGGFGPAKTVHGLSSK